MQEIIKIEFRIFANLRDILGFKIVFIDILKGSSIRDFLHIINEKYPNGPEFLRNIIDFEKNDILPYVKILIDGRILMGENILDTPITKNKSIVAIFPPVGGG
ncbi:MoaD/ThiS family protein [Promethearchaeum syntrophicum]|uniref:MoaD/ThiS family protein n=1 Tax=Promethearchaeum syntrophicum TaxID=2594042 RepID=A0A5B9D659_9ARCH|nr:MoaD/ThiS family protein [Candidatus Prometheoarchaeum syntrophicum]QEE14522.1 ThiS family protein [Candidatus Prometheoarchaeum syntrophicum]